MPGSCDFLQRLPWKSLKFSQNLPDKAPFFVQILKKKYSNSADPQGPKSTKTAFQGHFSHEKSIFIRKKEILRNNFDLSLPIKVLGIWKDNDFQVSFNFDLEI